MCAPGVSPKGDAGYSLPFAGPGGISHALFYLEHSRVFPGIAQQSVFTKNIRDWGLTEEKGFPSGNGAFRDLALAACCERLLPCANLCEFDL